MLASAVRYFNAAELVELCTAPSLTNNTVGNATETVGRNELIVIDDIGFGPLDHASCQLLFRLVAAGYERRAIAVGSHSPFNDWGRFVPDQRTAVSLVNPLHHHANIIITTGDSYRLSHGTSRPRP